MLILKYVVLIEMIVVNVVGQDEVISVDSVDTNVTAKDAINTWPLLMPSAVSDHDTVTYSPTWQDCYKNIIAASGNISSPLFPHMYPTRISCDWIIRVPEGHKVRIKFTTFDLPDVTNERCRHGYIEFGSYGEDNQRDVKVGHRCGRGSIEEFVSPDNRCWVYFTSGLEIVTNTSYSGFLLKFDAVLVENTDKTDQTVFFTLLLILLPLIGIILVCLHRRKKKITDPIQYDRNISRRFQRRHCNTVKRNSYRQNESKRVHIRVREISDDCQETAPKHSPAGDKFRSLPSGEYDDIPVNDRDYYVYRVMQNHRSNTRCSDVSTGSVFLHENTPRTDRNGVNAKYSRSGSGNFLDLPDSHHRSRNASYLSFFPTRSESLSTADTPCYILHTSHPDSSNMENIPSQSSFPGSEQIPVIHIKCPEDVHGNKIVRRPAMRKKSYERNRILNQRIFSTFSDSLAVKNKCARLSLPALYDIQEGVVKSPPQRSESLYSARSRNQNPPYPAGNYRQCPIEDGMGYLPGFGGNYFRFPSPETYSYTMNTTDHQNEMQVHSIPRPIDFCNSDILSEQEHMLPPVQRSLMGARSISVSQNTIQAYMNQDRDLDSLMTSAHDRQRNKSLTLSVQSLTALQKDTEASTRSTDQNKCCRRSLTMDVHSLTALQQEIQCRHNRSAISQHNHSAVSQHYIASPYNAGIQTQPLIDRDQISHLQSEFDNPSLEISAVEKNPDCHESFLEIQRANSVQHINPEDKSSSVDVNNNSLSGSLQDPCVLLLDDNSVNHSQVVVLEEGESMV